MAIGAMHVAREAGLRVPQDLPIVGIDGHDVARRDWRRNRLPSRSPAAIVSAEREERPMANVVFDDIQKVYPDGTQAIYDLNLEIADEEFVILVGPSGCGKSTALRMVAGLEDISGGKMYIGDKVVNDLTPKERDVAMVFQSYALYPHMTVADNMGFALKLAKVDKSEIDTRVKA